MNPDQIQSALADITAENDLTLKFRRPGSVLRSYWRRRCWVRSKSIGPK